MSFLVAVAAAATLSAPLSKPILCDGLRSDVATTCDMGLAFQGCTQSIRIHWEPVRLPPTVGSIKASRNWCDVTWESHLRIVQKKVEPAVCAKLVDQFAVSLKRFGDSSVVQGPCLPGIKEPQVYVSQFQVSSKTENLSVSAPPTKALPIRAARLEAARKCVLSFDEKALKKPWVLRCEVLPLAAFRWLKTTLDLVDARVELRNPLK